VLVQQLNGSDPVAEWLAHPIIERLRYPSLHGDDDLADNIRALIADELAGKIGSGNAGPA
jgi:hypothetical protein